MGLLKVNHRLALSHNIFVYRKVCDRCKSKYFDIANGGLILFFTDREGGAILAWPPSFGLATSGISEGSYVPIVEFLLCFKFPEIDLKTQLCRDFITFPTVLQDEV